MPCIPHLILTCPNHLSWDELYTTEVANHLADPTDEGTIWFDDSSAEDRLVAFLERVVVQDKILGDGIDRENCSFLDLGTGNGHFLIRLRGKDGGQAQDAKEKHEGQHNDEDNVEDDDHLPWHGRMLGVDYSATSIQLARQISTRHALTGARSITFTTWDMMTAPPRPLVLHGASARGWDIVLDKGTFDAISLSDIVDAQGRRQCEAYRAHVLPLIRIGGLLLLTSCNWTVEELRAWLDGPGLVFVDVVEYPSFRFGGRQGSTISSVCYQRVEG